MHQTLHVLYLQLCVRLMPEVWVNLSFGIKQLPQLPLPSLFPFRQTRMLLVVSRQLSAFPYEPITEISFSKGVIAFPFLNLLLTWTCNNPIMNFYKAMAQNIEASLVNVQAHLPNIH